MDAETAAKVNQLIDAGQIPAVFRQHVLRGGQPALRQPAAPAAPHPPPRSPCRWEGPVVTSCTLRCRSAAELNHVRRCDYPEWEDDGPEVCTRGPNNGKARSCAGCPAYEPPA